MFLPGAGIWLQTTGNVITTRHSRESGNLDQIYDIARDQACENNPQYIFYLTSGKEVFI